MMFLARVAVALSLLVGCVHAQMGSFFPGPGTVHSTGGGGGPLTFTATDAATAWTVGGNSVYSLSRNIGTAAADRIVVVSIYLDAGASVVTAVAIGGVSLSSVVSYGTSASVSQVIYASAPGAISGSGAQTINITTVNAFPAAIEAMVGTITGSASATVANTNNTPMAAPSPDAQTITATVPANGVAVIASQVDRAVTPSWTGATSDGNVQSATGYSALLAHGTSNTASYTGANNFGVGMLMATWQP